MRQRPDSHLRHGDIVPDFEVLDADRRLFRLSRELEGGPIILLFYPSDFGVVCSLQMRIFKEAREEFKRRGYRVVWISTDSIENHLKWRSKVNSPFRMLSDSGGEVSRLYGVFIEEEGLLKRFSNRSVFVIGSDGRLRYRWVADMPAQSPDLDMIIASLD